MGEIVVSLYFVLFSANPLIYSLFGLTRLKAASRSSPLFIARSNSSVLAACAAAMRSASASVYAETIAGIIVSRNSGGTWLLGIDNTSAALLATSAGSVPGGM